MEWGEAFAERWKCFCGGISSRWTLSHPPASRWPLLLSWSCWGFYLCCGWRGGGLLRVDIPEGRALCKHTGPQQMAERERKGGWKNQAPIPAVRQNDSSVRHKRNQTRREVKHFSYDDVTLSPVWTLSLPNTQRPVVSSENTSLVLIYLKHLKENLKAFFWGLTATCEGQQVNLQPSW